MVFIVLSIADTLAEHCPEPTSPTLTGQDVLVCRQLSFQEVSWSRAQVSGPWEQSHGLHRMSGHPSAEAGACGKGLSTGFPAVASAGEQRPAWQLEVLSDVHFKIHALH